MPYKATRPGLIFSSEIGRGPQAGGLKAAIKVVMVPCKPIFNRYSANPDDAPTFAIHGKITSL